MPEETTEKFAEYSIPQTLRRRVLHQFKRACSVYLDSFWSEQRAKLRKTEEINSEHKSWL